MHLLLKITGETAGAPKTGLRSLAFALGEFTLSGFALGGVILNGFVTAAIASSPPISPTLIAQTSYYYTGQATDGQRLLVDLGSINSVNNYDANFTYLLGTSQIAAQAHCVGSGAWTTLNDGTIHYAQSRATRDMVRIVCSYLDQSSTTQASSSEAPFSLDTAPSVTVPTSATPSEPPPPPFITMPETSSPEATTPVTTIAAAPPTATQLENSDVSLALVYDPASNVRETPNGRILCSIDTKRYINIYGHYQNNWYNTDACGSLGLIHISQIQF